MNIRKIIIYLMVEVLDNSHDGILLLAELQNQEGQTFVHVAAEADKLPWLNRYFPNLVNDSCFTMKDEFGHTPLLRATTFYSPKSVEFLLKQPSVADFINITGQDNESALHRAIYFEYTDIATQLCEVQEIDLNIKENKSAA